ncbi:MarR family transcriptional regulator [Streptomyces antioxidans]|uniref:MarR family transcriptional regulator n=1 Tax=Streptomyces antioxidans TaxID=1507734 RepID=A0A1V4CV32_9ACTN|nr:MarR family winged helix-turn-helix transcriptional regulator [Streptomyces antioxidans]OPF71274.1 MarR family transcriptional regulator [Streptomyces antioxidans]
MTALDPTTPGPTTSGPGPATPRSAAPGPVTPSPTAPNSAELAERLRTALQNLLPALRGSRGEHGDLTPSRQAALGALATHGSMRISTLATRLGIALPTTSRMVELLDASGWIERTPDPEDRRASLIALTDTGRELLGAVRHEAAARLATRMDKLSPDERQALFAALPALESLAADGSAAAADPER